MLGPLLEALAPRNRILLTGPVGPDGDSIGACLALQRLLHRRGAKADVVGTLPVRYQWLPGGDAVIADAGLDPAVYDAVVVLDGDRHRLTPPAAAAFAGAAFKALVDHHASSTAEGYDLAWLQADAASTTEMLFNALRAANEPLDRELAILLYTGVIFDTGGFCYSNARPSTLRMAADLMDTGFDHAQVCLRILMERRPSGLRLAGAVYSEARFVAGGRLAIGRVSHARARELGVADGDVEGVVDGLVHTRGVEIAALVVEKSDGRVKVSLRGRGRINLVELARTLSPTGGGHVKAAGASVPGTLDEVEAAVESAAIAALRTARLIVT